VEGGSGGGGGGETGGGGGGAETCVLTSKQRSKDHLNVILHNTSGLWSWSLLVPLWWVLVSAGPSVVGPGLYLSLCGGSWSLKCLNCCRWQRFWSRHNTPFVLFLLWLSWRGGGGFMGRGSGSGPSAPSRLNAADC